MHYCIYSIWLINRLLHCNPYRWESLFNMLFYRIQQAVSYRYN
nr:MAG TPA: hypothetical protein [Caudoviricetes sp.]